ncbi:MAG TPA: DUF2079 domain-containing protein [Candidatus Acidoferrum sp.]|nr:DUF2079 domain-containing protein [Candidatus Acidoferrum sp.]
MPRLSTARAAAALITVAAATVYSTVALYRHDRFASNALDLAVQDQTVWGYSRFQMIHNTVLGIPNLLGDHFHPILMVLAPFYWIWDSAGVLLVAQGILLALAGVPIYLWAEERLGEVAALAFLLTYAVFWGILAGVVYDFHHVVFAVPALSAALYAVLTRRNRLLWSMVAVVMLTREDLTLTLIALGFYIAAFQRRYILGAVLMGLNAVWFALLIGVIMPALAGGPYRHWTYDALGSGPIQSAVFVLRHPVASLQLLFVPTHKALVWIGSFLSWGFLPLISPITLVALPTFFERMWSSSPNFWSFQFQYSMIPAPILAFAAIDTCARIKSMTGDRLAWLSTKLLPIGALAAGAIFTIGLIRPFAEVSTYLSADRAAQIQSCLDTIPNAASVSASNTLVPHLSHRAAIYVVTVNTDTDYIAVDPTTYPNFAPGEEAQLRDLVHSALAGSYGVSCAKGLTLVLARGAPGQTLTPELERWLAGACSGRACI